MRIGTANIRNFPDMAPAAVKADARTVARHTTLCGLQEIQPGEDTAVVRAGLGPGWWLAGEGHETPIVGRGDLWTLEDHNVIPLERPAGLPRPQNRFSAVTSVVVKPVKRPHLPTFAVVNTHLISGAFNGPRLPVLVPQWEREGDAYIAEAHRLHSCGLTVFLTGDLNAHAPHGMSCVLWWAFGIDYIGIMGHRRGVTIGKASDTTFRLNSDHDLAVVSGALTKPGTP